MQATRVRAIGAAFVDERLAGAPRDPVRFACEYGDRVAHVHLKHVVQGAGQGRRPDRRGHGCPASTRVRGWLVLEQDTAITAEEPTVAGGPMRDARESIAFLHQSARMTEEINR